MKKILMCLITLVLFSACGNSPQNQDGIEVLSLNNGEKWEVNAEMTPHIIEAESVLTTYISAGNSDHVELANSLKSQNNKLIKSCTMKGASHDELHKWLNPHIVLIDKLAKEENSEEAVKIIAKLEKSFEQYNTYFK